MPTQCISNELRTFTVKQLYITQTPTLLYTNFVYSILKLTFVREKQTRYYFFKIFINNILILFNTFAVKKGKKRHF